MSTTVLDHLTEEYYSAVSFRNSIAPDINTLSNMFYGPGLIVNNSLEIPETYTAQSFVQSMEAQIATGEIRQFLQYEIYSNTEVFGGVARRLSVYQYSFADHEVERMPRGLNFIHYVKIGTQWKITSMVWADENENQQLPAEYLKLAESIKQDQ